jgi:hypothetical protein
MHTRKLLLALLKMYELDCVAGTHLSKCTNWTVLLGLTYQNQAIVATKYSASSCWITQQTACLYIDTLRCDSTTNVINQTWRKQSRHRRNLGEGQRGSNAPSPVFFYLRNFFWLLCWRGENRNWGERGEETGMCVWRAGLSQSSPFFSHDSLTWLLTPKVYLPLQCY